MDLLANPPSTRSADTAQQSAPRSEFAGENLQTLLYALSHDLKGQVSSIAAYTNLVLEEYSAPLGEEGTRWLQYVQGGAHTLKERLEGLMNYCRIQQAGTPFGRLDLVPIARTLIREVSAASSVEPELECSSDSVWIYSEEQQIRTLIQNLLSNAVKYQSPGREPIVRIELAVADDGVRLSVADNGIGFDETRLEEACRMFRRLVGEDEYDGSGVGLALVSRIVHRHAATLSATSSPGAGTRFSVLFPEMGEAEDV